MYERLVLNDLRAVYFPIHTIYVSIARLYHSILIVFWGSGVLGLNESYWHNYTTDRTLVGIFGIRRVS